MPKSTTEFEVLVSHDSPKASGNPKASFKEVLDGKQLCCSTSGADRLGSSICCRALRSREAETPLCDGGSKG